MQSANGSSNVLITFSIVAVPSNGRFGAPNSFVRAQHNVQPHERHPDTKLWAKGSLAHHVATYAT